MTELTLPAGRLEERFSEKKPAYTEAEAIAEANRCIYCVDAPCIKACPTSIDIPTFIRKIATGNVKGSARTILTQNLLGESCGQVCPVEVPARARASTTSGGAIRSR
jgi:glutamate synthase (NADPH/NADH) small chain